MKNNLLDKEFIESDDIHDFLCEFVWLTRVYLVDESLFCYILSISSLNIELI